MEPIVSHGGPARRGQATGMVAAVGGRGGIAPKGRSVVRVSPASHAYFTSPRGSRPVEAEAGFSHLATVRPAATRTSHARVHISSLLICLLPGLQLDRKSTRLNSSHRRKGWMGDPLDVHFLQSR